MACPAPGAASAAGRGGRGIAGRDGSVVTAGFLGRAAARPRGGRTEAASREARRAAAGENDGGRTTGGRTTVRAPGRVRPLRGVVRHRNGGGRGPRRGDGEGGDRASPPASPSIGNEEVSLFGSENVPLRSGADRGEAGGIGARSTASRSRSTPARGGRGRGGGDRGTAKQRRGRPSIGNEEVRLSSNETVRLRSGADRGEAGRSGACSTTSRSRSTLHRQRKGHRQRGRRRGDGASRPASSGGRQDRGGRRLRPEGGRGREGRPAAAEGSRR